MLHIFHWIIFINTPTWVYKLQNHVKKLNIAESNTWTRANVGGFQSNSSIMDMDIPYCADLLCWLALIGFHKL